jgi:guanylate kinase
MGSLVVLSGPSGSGKTSIAREVCKRIGEDKTMFSISSTTRAPRNGEKDGVDYYFLTKEEFLADIEKGYFLEWAEVHGNYYGTSKIPIEKAMKEGKIVFLDIDVQGFESVKKIYPNTLTSVFVTTKNKQVLIERLKSRGTETEESLKIRLINAFGEMRKIDEYEFLIINDKFEESVEQLETIAKVSLIKSSKENIEEFIKEWNEEKSN